MPDWQGMQEAVPYAWAGAAGIIGRLMYHSQQVQRGKRKPLSWVLVLDLPIALGMGWGVLGLCVWGGLGPEATSSAAIAAGYLGPFAIDTLFSRMATKYFGKEPTDGQ